jgi:HK97 family phage portal protein
LNVLERVLNQGTSLFKRDINSLTPAGLVTILGSLNTAAGKRVTPLGALGLTQVYHAIDLISNDYASLPHRVSAYSEIGKETLRNHNVSRLLNFEPNYYQTPLEYHRMMSVNRLMFGNAYAFIDRYQSSGQIRNLLPIHPENVINITELEGELFYNVRLGKGLDNTTIISSRDMIHIKDLSITNSFEGSNDKFKGKSRIEACSEAIGAGMALRDFTSTFFGNGANIGTVVESEVGAIQDDAQRKSLENSLKTNYTGPTKSHTALVLPSGYKLSAGVTKFNQQQSQFIETRILLVEEIAQIFNLPLSKMRTKENGTSYNSQEQSNIEYTTETLSPYVKCFEQEYNTKLFSASERFETMVNVVLKDRLKGDMKTQGEYVNTRVFNGTMSINEAKVFFDENEIGEEGNVRMVPVNMQPVERMIEGPEKEENETNGEKDN